MVVIGKGHGRYKSRNLINFKVDYFKAKINPKLMFFNKKTRLEKMGLSVNSNMFFLSDKTRIEFKQYPNLDQKYRGYYEIVDIESGINLAFILLAGYMRKIGSVEINDIFEVSGQGLILRDLDFYLNLLDFLGYEIEKFKRVDLAMDINQDINYIYKLIEQEVVKKTHRPIITKKNGLETLYIGEVNKVKNTYKILRIYNKILDTRKKNKSFLYPEYEGHKFITRFEVELRRDKAKFFTVDKLKDINYLYRVFVHEVYYLNFQFFKFITLDDVEEFERKKKIILGKSMRSKAKQKRLEHLNKYGKEFIDEKEEKTAVQTFIAYGKKLLMNGKSKQNILDILVINEILDEKWVEKQKFVLKEISQNKTNEIS